MATVTKSIGTNSRDYSTFTAWEAANGGGDGLGNDDCIGEVYDDSPFDEHFTIDFSANSIAITVPAAERHDGTAGTGARIVNSSDSGGYVLDYNLDADDTPFIVEWLEFDKNGKSGKILEPGTSGTSGYSNSIVRNCLFHDIESNDSTEGRAIVSLGDYTACNNIVYNITGGAADTQSIYAMATASNRDLIAYNNTVYKLYHNRSGENAIGITIPSRSGCYCKNNVICEVGGVSGTFLCFNLGALANNNNNASSDATADDDDDVGSSCLINITTTDQFVSTASGSEDLHLKSGADCIGAGADLGTYASCNIDIDGRDRNAEGDTWDIGAHQFVAAGGATDNLTATDITAGIPVVGTPTIGQAHALTASAVTAGVPIIDSPTIGQVHGLTAASIETGAPSIGSPILSQAHELSSQDIETASPVIDAPTIGQSHVLTGQDIEAQAPVIDTPIIAQAHALAASDVYAGAPVIGSPTLDATGDTLTATDITAGTPEIGSPNLGQTHALVSQDVEAGQPVIDAPTLGQVHVLAGNDVVAGAPVVGAPVLGANAHSLTALGITSGVPIIGTPVLGQIHTLSASDITAGFPTIGSPTLDYSPPDVPWERTIEISTPVRAIEMSTPVREFIVSSSRRTLTH